MISRFFIDRPIFASVLSIVITLGGGIALLNMPIAMYPPISPPVVQVDCTYPGASAQVVSQTVATPIEQQVNGVEDMLYMASQCTNDGAYNLTVTFRHGIDLNMAQVLVQNRLSLALPLLPDVIKQTGVTTRKKAPDILLVLAINSKTKKPDGYQLSLMPSAKGVGELPTEGKGLIAVASVDHSLHFRIFDRDGKRAVDTDETRLKGSAGPLKELRELLDKSWPPQDLSETDKGEIIAAVTSIVGHSEPGWQPYYDQLYLSNYALMHMKDEIARLPGVGDINVSGQRDYSMRIWVDPEKLASRDMTASDVAKAIRQQNLQVATGQIGQPPIPSGQELQVPLSTLGRLVEPEQFEQMILKKSADGRIVRLKDVARIELGPKNQDISCSVNGNPSAGLVIFQLPDANALDTAVAVKAKVNELVEEFPPGLNYEIRYDTTPFISESISEVFKTLRDAVILVAAVVLLFLQNWRSALIPLIAVPVAIIGTFAILVAMGFTLNNLTLFGLVLAIGIVVDDAIVVVEAVEHHVEHGMTPRDATIRAMDEVSGPVIAIGLVLTAVFVPCAFISGIVGQFFRQFALTIATLTLISAFNSLTLSPALAAILIKPRNDSVAKTALPRLAYAIGGALVGYSLLAALVLGQFWEELEPILISGGGSKYRFLAPLANGNLAGRLKDSIGIENDRAIELSLLVLGALLGWCVGPFIDRLLVWFFGIFNAGFRLATKGYTRIVSLLLRGSLAALVVYGGLIYLTYDMFQVTPKGFIPTQDMGYLLANVQLTDSVSIERTTAIMNRVEQIARSTPGIRHTQAMTGQSLLLSANGSNFGSMFCILDSFDRRRTKDLYSENIIKVLRDRFATEVPEAVITVLGPPPVRGVGRAGGFKLMVEDRGDNSLSTLQGQTDNLVDKAKKYIDPVTKQKTFMSAVSTFRANVPQYYVDVNRAECMTKDVALQDLFDTLRIYLGSLYVNDYNQFGRTWQVIVQADSRFRNVIEYVPQLKVRNSQGTMVPVGTLASLRQVNGPLVLSRYNTYPAAPINGSAAQGVSSGEAIATMQALAEQGLLGSMAMEWTELAYLEIQAGSTAMIIFGFAVVMVFLVLAAQYESWSMPLAIILVVPMCLLSAIIGVRIAGEDINIFTQIGFVVLVGLASKNAILIVEFAKQRRDAGESRRHATLEACALRIRPIIMTSLAFILGVLPLLTGHGAGAEMRRTLGTTVFSGMLGVTIFGVFLTPVFYSVIDWLGETSFFASPKVKRIGLIAIFVLAFPLSLLFLLIRRRTRQVRQGPAAKPAPPPEEL